MSEKLKNGIKILVGQALLELLIKIAQNIILINKSRTSYIMIQRSVDNFETAHKNIVKFGLGYSSPLILNILQTNCTVSQLNETTLQKNDTTQPEFGISSAMT